MHIPFNNSYAELPSAFYHRVNPTPVKSPHLIAYNDQLASILGIKPNETNELSRLLSGNYIPSNAIPLAQIYAGHQFGHWTPQLGDGRAILLGELIDSDGVRWDIQLKGAGRTAFSRMGDGRAWLGPVLREFIVSEAMHALGIPTTRALAVVTTSELVFREQGALPGAILTRVASSHIRIGTFQIFAVRNDIQNLKKLTEYAISRHYPDVIGPLGLLRAVCNSQAKLIAHWMSVGFIHGVMNTDNCAISGETIDYGPCAFMDAYDPNALYSSIDQFGRYAYSNQPNILIWNLAQLATALIQQIEKKEEAAEEATEIVKQTVERYQSNWEKLFLRKIGISNKRHNDIELVSALFKLMTENQSDFTNAFRALSSDAPDIQFKKNPSAFHQWVRKWTKRLTKEKNPNTVMQSINPVIIPRNHRIEQLILAAVNGDYSPFHRLHNALKTPYEENPGATDLQHPPNPEEIVRATFCGT